jgi:hypothetical protein
VRAGSNRSQLTWHLMASSALHEHLAVKVEGMQYGRSSHQTLRSSAQQSGVVGAGSQTHLGHQDAAGAPTGMLLQRLRTVGQPPDVSPRLYRHGH